MRSCMKKVMLGLVPAVGAMGLPCAARAEAVNWPSGDYTQGLPSALQQAMAWPAERPAGQVPEVVQAEQMIQVEPVPFMMIIAGERQ